MSKRDYYAIADDLLRNGTLFQKVVIRYFMKYHYGIRRDSEIERFIDIQINLGNVKGV